MASVVGPGTGSAMAFTSPFAGTCGWNFPKESWEKQAILALFSSARRDPSKTRAMFFRLCRVSCCWINAIRTSLFTLQLRALFPPMGITTCVHYGDDHNSVVFNQVKNAEGEPPSYGTT